MTDTMKIVVEVDAKTGRASIRALGDDLNRLGDRGKSAFQSFDGTATAVLQTFGKLKGVMGGLGLVAGLGQMIKMGADFETSTLQMSETFQGAADAMMDKSADLARKFRNYYNLEELNYAFTKTADSMARYGITGEKYFTLVARAADVGAAKGLELKESIDRIESAMRGEAEASEYLGLTLNDTYMKNIALNGALKDQWEKMDDSQKTFNRYLEFMAQSEKYTDATTRATNTLSGALKGLYNRMADAAGEGISGTSSTLAGAVNWLNDSVQTPMGRIEARLAQLEADRDGWRGMILGEETYQREIDRLKGDRAQLNRHLERFPGSSDIAGLAAAQDRAKVRKHTADELKTFEEAGKGYTDSWANESLIKKLSDDRYAAQARGYDLLNNTFKSRYTDSELKALTEGGSRLGTDPWMDAERIKKLSDERYAVQARGYDLLDNPVRHRYTDAEMRAFADAGEGVAPDSWMPEEAKKRAEERAAAHSRGMDLIIEKEEESSKAMIELSQRTADAMENNFSDFFFSAFTGKMQTLDDLTKSILLSMQRAVADYMGQLMRVAMFGNSGSSGLLATIGPAIADKFSGGSSAPHIGAGGTTAVGMHGGGVAGRDASFFRVVPPEIFRGAPRLHSGLAPDEFAAILQRGEVVLTRDQAAGARPLQAGAQSIRVEIKNESGQPMAVTKSSARMDLGEMVISVWLDAYANNKFGLRTAVQGVQ